MYIFLVFILFTFASCASNRPIATVHHERIETQMQAVPIGSDTIEIEYRLQSTNNRYSFPTDSTDNTDIFYPPDLTMRSRLRRNRATDNTDFDAGEASASSVSSVDSVRDKKNSVRIKSTRGVSVQTTHTDSSMHIKLTLRPDTIFVPYTTHIRSDTIVAPDPTTRVKLNTARWQIAMLLLIIIVATIIFIDRKTR